MAVFFKKYWTLFKIAWSNGLVYRASLLIWRFRNFLATVMALTVWTVIFNGQSTAFGYSRPEMTSYVLLVSVLQSVILASSLHGLAGEIYSGTMSQHLLKPENLFVSYATLEVADKLRNLVFSMGEGVILFFIFHPIFSLPSGGTLALFVLWALLGTVIHFFITIAFGTLGFWSPDTWGPKFVFFMIVDFTAGKLYPLDILPAAVRNLLYLTPFPYLSYVQIQLFLGRLTPTEITSWTIGIIFWTVLSYWLATSLWRRGLKSYEAAGL